MNWKGGLNLSNDSQAEKDGLWLIVAMVVPLLQTASGCAWPVVLAESLLSIVIYLCLSGIVQDKPSGWLNYLWTCIVISQFLFWPNGFWPKTNTVFISLVLLALAAWAVWKNAAERASCALFWLIVIITSVTLLAAVKEIRIVNLKPTTEDANAYLPTVLLLPMLIAGRRKEKKRILSVGFFAVAVSVITIGVISVRQAAAAETPFYELSRSLTLFGFTKRFESLVSVAMTLGVFATICFLMEAIADDRENVLPAGILSSVIYILNVRMDGIVLTIGSLLAWVVLPVIRVLSKKLRIFEKKG